MFPAFALLGLVCIGLIWFLIARSRGHRITLVELAGACGAMTVISLFIASFFPLLEWLGWISKDQANAYGLLTLPVSCGCFPVGVVLTIILSILAAVQKPATKLPEERHN